MKKLKIIFSPRNLLIIVSVFLLFVTLPEITNPAMSQTSAIVTMLCIDKQDDEIVIAPTVLTPADGKKADYQVYSAKGKTLAQAVDNVSLLIGKDIGFAQCEIMALGDKLCEESIVPVLDYITRTKKVGRNAVLINFVGDLMDFSHAISDLNDEKSLKLENIINFGKRYIISQDSNIESFYKGYFSDISLGVMPKVKLQTQETETAIQVSSTDGSGASIESTSTKDTGQEKKYIINDGTTCIFKQGIKRFELSPKDVKKLNIFLNQTQEGSILIENVTDEIMTDASVILNVEDKEIKFSTEFIDDKPVFKANVEMLTFIEEVDQSHVDDKFLRRNAEFFTPAVIQGVKDKVISDMQEVVDLCRENKTDLIGVYKYFYRFHYEDFNKYLKEVGKDNYLDNIEYEFSVEVNSKY